MNAIVSLGTDTRRIARHNSLPASLEVASLVQALLPEGVALSSWHIGSGEIRGQVSALPEDDAMVIAQIAAVSRKPGWSFRADPPVSGQYSHRSYIQIVASAEVSDVRVEIWAHVSAEANNLLFEGRVAA